MHAIWHMGFFTLKIADLKCNLQIQGRDLRTKDHVEGRVNATSAHHVMYRISSIADIADCMQKFLYRPLNHLGVARI